ncbi:MAG: urea ABC transporter permease subunit UrtC [Succinivibrio sp.]|nr:urea ABC transporter permease subunit UrtC [Succinivibrio sp.]
MNELTVQEKFLSGETKSFILVTALLGAVVVMLSLMPEGSFIHLPVYVVNLLGKYVTYAILALSVDLVWGYLGILTLGHCVFFALGGYVMGMYLTRSIGAQGVYGDPLLPDFMVFLNWHELPWYWQGLQYFPLAALLIICVPALLAYVFGRLAFFSRVSGVYLSIITQALTYAMMLAFFLNELGFGGNNGLTDFKTLLGFSLQTDGMRILLFALSVVTLCLCYLLCRSVVVSKLGRLCIAVRDAENRVRFIGYRVENIKLLIFVLSAVIAGIAGALYVPQVGIINPSEFSPVNSIEIIVCVALGGRGRLYGAVIGAFLVHIAKTMFTNLMPEFWLFALGALFVLVTLFLKDGVAGLLCVHLKTGSTETLTDKA